MTPSGVPLIYVTVEAAKNAGSGAEDLALKVLSLEYEESEKAVDKCILTLDNSDLRFFDHVIFEKGTRLRVSWGYAGRMAPVRAVVVQKVTGDLTLKVEAQSAGVLMQKVTRTRTYENTTRSELVHALAKENGYGDTERFIEDTDRTIPVQSQAGMTDFAFLKRLAQLEGFEFFVDFDGLHWHPRRFGQRPIKVLQYFLPPGVGDITGFSVDNDATAKPGATVAKARDPLDKKDVSSTASDTTTPRTTLGSIGELLGVVPPDGTGNAKKTDPAPLPGETDKVDSMDGTIRRIVVPQGAGSGDVKNTTDAKNVKADAKAPFVKAQQAAIQLSLKLVGDPNAVAKTVVEVRGLGQRLSGKYYLTELKHKVAADGGYTMEAKSRTDGGNKGTKSSTSKADQNKKDAPGADAATKLTEVDTIDPKDGTKRTVFKDTRGRENAS